MGAPLKISRNRLNGIIKGKRGMTAETAWLLAGYFRNSPEFWMNLQTAHDLTKARAARRRRGAAA